MATYATYVSKALANQAIFAGKNIESVNQTSITALNRLLHKRADRLCDFEWQEHKHIFAKWINYVWLEKMGSCEMPILAFISRLWH